MNLDKQIKKMTEEAETQDKYFRRELEVDKIKESVKTLRRETGASMRYCKRALELTNNDIQVAKAYIRLKSQAVVRKKTVKGGHIVPWDDADYLREAYMEVENETSD